MTLPKPAAKVIINARTGSVVMNQAVTLEPSAVAHGNLSVTITNQASVSQPGAFSSGKTQVVNNAQIDIRAEKGQIMNLPSSAKLTDVVRALNSLGRHAAGSAVDPAGLKGRRRIARRSRSHLRIASWASRARPSAAQTTC